jgi:uncharacterized protein (TIGR03435 family)
MPEPDDLMLLRQYAGGDEFAFTMLFERHVHLVYSVALRQCRNPSHAEEVAQAVFILLAQKAKSLSPKTVLSGWLYQAARLTTASLIKREIRRQRREQEVYMQTLTEPDTSLWEQISPLLDDAMGRLDEKDRNAIVLRFFENRTPQEVATALKLNEVTARKRVSRALEKLRTFFAKRGVVLTAAIIAGTISGNSVQAAPAALANSATAVMLAKGTVASTSTLALVKGALKIMAWSKAQTAIVIGMAALLAAGTATLGIKEIAAYQHAPWQEKYDLSILDSLAPQVKVLPSLPSTLQSHLHVIGGQNSRVLALGQSVPDLLMLAYGVHPAQLIWNVPVPEGKYDFVATYPQIEDSKKAMRDEIKKMFGLTGRHEMIETNVLILTVKSPDATGLLPAAGQFSGNEGPDFYSAHDRNINTLVDYLEQNLGMVIIDQTKLAGNFDIDFKWDETPDGLKQVLLDELGLILTPSRQTVDFVIVDKAP